MKVLLKRFHLNGNTIGFHPQTQKLELVGFRNKNEERESTAAQKMGRVKERGGGGLRGQNRKSRPFHVVPRIGLAPKPHGNTCYADIAYKVLDSVLFTCALQPQQQFTEVFLQRCARECTVRSYY